MAPGWMNLDNPSSPGDLYFGGEKSTFGELSVKERLIGFGMCFVGGFFISMLGAILLITGSGRGFAVFFGLGAIISLVGTGFLIGFWRQAKLMFKPVRIIASLIMLGAIAMCFISAFLLPAALCILFVIIEYCAMLWYSLSYIPYARDGVKGLVSKFF